MTYTAAGHHFWADYLKGTIRMCPVRVEGPQLEYQETAHMVPEEISCLSR
jgi:hypothetical protein